MISRITPDAVAQEDAPAFVIDNEAVRLLQMIENTLQQLTQLQSVSPSDSAFAKRYQSLLAYIDSYHSQVLSSSHEYTVPCVAGCASCCCHWVEDVNSFEVRVIADYIQSTCPDEIPQILRQCRSDCDELLRLQDLVTAKLTEQHEMTKEVPALPESMDLLLGVFYQMRRPCPLLSKEGTCFVYPVRPITCRMYISVSDPLRCDPDYINGEVIPTCMIDLNPGINTLLDTMHAMFARGDKDDTGLRSQLLHYLG